MSDKDKKRLIRVALIALVIFLLWNWRDSISRLFSRQPQTDSVVYDENTGTLTEAPELIYPNISINIPPLSYTPRPYQPVQYNPAPITGLSKGNCSLCGDYGDNSLVIPMPYEDKIPKAQPQVVNYATQKAVAPMFSQSMSRSNNTNWYWDNGTTGRLF